ncbi:hypothetical protein [Dyadobacter sp. NIV53]|uniref:hypothetical protein n=1 Tax=Dyadobacter sp. NIV53 TaxID=2861765 RepID=UPI001C879D41|nr:hypothetical protein [Dyadobacter sp. NIV53]
MKRQLLWLVFSLMIMPHILKAQTIDLVKDINVSGPSQGVIMRERAVAGHTLFFLAMMLRTISSSGKVTGLPGAPGC